MIDQCSHLTVMTLNNYMHGRMTLSLNSPRDSADNIGSVNMCPLDRRVCHIFDTGFRNQRAFLAAEGLCSTITTSCAEHSPAYITASLHRASMFTTGLFQTGRTALCGCQQQPRRVHARAGRRCLTVRAATAVPAEVSVQQRGNGLPTSGIAGSWGIMLFLLCCSSRQYLQLVTEFISR